MKSEISKGREDLYEAIPWLADHGDEICVPHTIVIGHVIEHLKGVANGCWCRRNPLRWGRMKPWMDDGRGNLCQCSLRC